MLPCGHITQITIKDSVSKPIPVTYVSGAPRVNFSDLFDDESGENGYKWIFSKHHDWRYEKEWRLVVQQGNRLYPIPGKVESVIFGLRMDNSKRDVVSKVFENQPKIEFNEAIGNPNLLQLEIKEIISTK